MKLRLGIHIGPQNISMADLRRLWRFADEHLDWISVWDHFYEAPYVNGESPHFEAVAMMAAIATDTRRVRIGNMVFCMLYRNPGLLAKSLVTIDHLSDGRLEIGLGAGWHEAEFAAYGYEFPPIKQRLDMLEEGTIVLKSLLSQPRTEHHGRFYSMNNAALYPKPVQAHVPLWIGGRGERRTLRIAARHADGWNVPYIGPDEFKHKSGVLDRWCDKEGRDPATIKRSLNVHFFGVPAGAPPHAAREKLEQTLGRAWESQAAGALIGGPAAMVDQVGGFIDVGVTALNIAFRPPVDWDGLQAFVEDVMPKFA